MLGGEIEYGVVIVKKKKDSQEMDAKERNRDPFIETFLRREKNYEGDLK